jgi:arginase family enzyme
MDERMHTTPWFHSTNIPNAPASNLVQMGIGGWYDSRPGMKVAREKRSTVITTSDVEELGVEKAVEIALECAWKDAEAVFLSFDIDSIDAGFVPGTGSPGPGGLLPREALKALRMVAREGICGMEVVEIAPPYDVSDMTAQLGLPSHHGRARDHGRGGPPRAQDEGRTRAGGSGARGAPAR